MGIITAPPMFWYRNARIPVLQNRQYRRPKPVFLIGNVLFQPAPLVPLPTRFNIQNRDDSGNLDQEMELLPIERFVPTCRSGHKCCNKKRYNLIHRLQTGIVLDDAYAIGMYARREDVVEANGGIVDDDGDAHEPGSGCGQESEGGKECCIIGTGTR
jgi:hypothetical protein